MWRALTWTAFTALLDESINPFVKDPKTPGSVGVEVPSALSSCCWDLGDKRNPIPLVKRAKGDFPEFPGCRSSCTDGFGILRFLAHEDMPEVDNMDDVSRTDVSCLVEVEF